MAGMLVLVRPAKACRMAQASAEKLEHTWPAEKERAVSVPQSEQLERTSKLRNRDPDHQIVRENSVKGSKSCTLIRNRRLRARA